MGWSSGKSKHRAKRVGRAFCFLPLPAETGLPVHVHGYFELSSNRRNIWFGDDMAGEGAMCLMELGTTRRYCSPVLLLFLDARKIMAPY